MMFEAWHGVVWALVSAVFVVALAATDRKRRGARKKSSPSALRLAFLVGALLPGLYLASMVGWADFFIWISLAAVFGWGIAALASKEIWERARN